MTVRFYVEGWDKQPTREVRVYQAQTYGLDESYFDPEVESGLLLRDEQGRAYSVERQPLEPFPEVEMANGNFMELLRSLPSIPGMPVSSPYEGQLSPSKLGKLQQALMALLNRRALAEKTGSIERAGNIVTVNHGGDYFMRKAQEILKLVVFAQERKVSIYWA